MDLYLRKSDRGQLGPEIYRVVLKDDGDEVEIGSIGVQHSAGAHHRQTVRWNLAKLGETAAPLKAVIRNTLLSEANWED